MREGWTEEGRVGKRKRIVRRRREKETNCIISKSKGGKLERVGLRE